MPLCFPKKHFIFILYCLSIVVTQIYTFVVQARGPYYQIPNGRKDGTRSKIEDTRNLPPPTFNTSELIKMFGQHGFTAQEMVALSGKSLHP